MASPFTTITTLDAAGAWTLLGTPAAAKNGILEVLTPGMKIEYAYATAAADLVTQQGHYASYSQHAINILIPGTGICARVLGGAHVTGVKVALSIGQ